MGNLLPENFRHFLSAAGKCYLKGKNVLGGFAKEMMTC